MGCIESRRHDDENVEAIAAIEKTLNFYSNTPLDIENHFKKFAYEGKINQSQLKRIIDSANLKQPESTNTSWLSKDRIEKNKTENFYKHFLKKDPEKEAALELQPIIICAFLMSQGNASEKASLIWDSLDLACTGTITKKQVEFYIDTAVKLTHEYLLEYSLGENYPNNQNRVVEQQTIYNLQKTWRQIDLKEAFMKQMNLTEGKINQRDFISRISKTHEVDFTSTFGIREWLLKQSKQIEQTNNQSKLENQQSDQKSGPNQQDQKAVYGGEN